MLLVKIPKEFYEQNLPDDDLFVGHRDENILGLVVNDGQRTYFSPLLNVAELTHPLSDPNSFVSLSDVPNDSPEDIISLEKTIVLEDEFFDQDIAKQAIIAPNEYRNLKVKELEYQQRLSHYVLDYQLQPNDYKFRNASLKYFKPQLEIYENQLDVLEDEAPLVQPFYDIHSQKQYDLLKHTVDYHRIEHHDREKYQKVKEKELDLEL
ncbi:hypothetical protein [Lactococcus kimchii]|uniref:hypothetical protein n=1 Tax=Lactococcus sp. S-13 TaxID=2507158 RepID=UPI001023CD54|nr:hypothetical protein [Lactococcus sp. S-13]RZI47885.1 hypothetical protein EQJ87_10710 [Lactococcus sp. S-13]